MRVAVAIICLSAQAETIDDKADENVLFVMIIRGACVARCDFSTMTDLQIQGSRQPG